MTLTHDSRSKVEPTDPWQDGPMLALDLETTGIDVHNDRIVTAALVVITPRHEQRSEVTPHGWLADPGVPIPTEAAAIHGISTDRARRDGQPAPKVIAEIAAELRRLWTATTPLCVFHAAYDLTLLDAEMRRHLGQGLTLNGPVVDPMLIDWHVDSSYRPSGRKLPDLCAYHGVRLDRDGVHTAHADALAAARLAWRLAHKHPHLCPSDLDELYRMQSDWHRRRQLAAAKRFDSRGETARAAQARAAAQRWPVLAPPHL